MTSRRQALARFILRPGLAESLDALAAAPAARRTLAALVALGAVALLWAAPDTWRIAPDSGFHIGSAMELAENGRYWFGGRPNLLYFPGVSVLLVPVVFLWGQDFGAIQLVAAALGALSLVLAHRYYDPARYGLPGLLLPLVLLCNTLFLATSFTVSSNGVMLVVVLAAFMTWRRYLRDHAPVFLALTALLAAYAPLVRFEGLCLSAAFALAFLMAQWGRAGPAAALARAVPLGILVVLPFVLWSARNYLDYTPDAFNMLNKRFFGQSSQRLYAPMSLRLDWVTADWQWPLYRLMYFLDRFLDGPLGARLSALVPPAVSLPALLALAALGARRWYRGAHGLEVAFAVLMFLFLVAWNLRPGQSLVIVPRYWVPLLPVALVMVTGGVVVVVQWLRRPAARLGAAAAALGLAALVLAVGVATVGHYLRSDGDYRAGLAAMGAAADYVHEHAPPGSTVATTDWGAMPLLLDRPTVLALNDESHYYTVHLLLRRRAGYLVVVDEMAVLSAAASRAMVAEYPQVFSEVFRRDTAAGPLSTAVYAIDRERLLEAAVHIPEPQTGEP